MTRLRIKEYCAVGNYNQDTAGPQGILGDPGMAKNETIDAKKGCLLADVKISCMVRRLEDTHLKPMRRMNCQEWWRSARRRPPPR